MGARAGAEKVNPSCLLEWGSTEGRGASGTGDADGGEGQSLEVTWTPGTAVVAISGELRNNVIPFLWRIGNFSLKKKKG